MATESLTVTPSELKFRFELRKQIPTSLDLYNPTDKTMAFKVKTTSPKKYCVRPNTGIIAPGKGTQVTVIMQLQKETPADIAACKDKFLVQSVPAGEDTSEQDFNELFNKDRNKGIMHETKLRVSYITPGPPPSPVPENAEGEAAAAEPHADASRTYGGNSAAVTPVASGTELQVKLNSAIQSLQVATSEKKAAELARDQLMRENMSLKTRNTELMRNPPTTIKAEPATKASMLAGFTLLHLLIAAIIAFCLGRFT